MYVVAASVLLGVVGAAIYFLLQPSWFQPAAISSADWVQLTDFPTPPPSLHSPQTATYWFSYAGRKPSSLMDRFI